MNPSQLVVENIKSRRSVKPPKMNGNVIDESIITQLLECADAAPTHARTEPWRFHIYSGESLKDFCALHSELYWNHTPEDKRVEQTRLLFANHYQYASHLIIVSMKRTVDAKIPWEEEYAACCAAVQNIMLAANAYDIHSLWSTGGMAYKPVMKEYLQLDTEDRVVAFLYLGYADDIDSKLVRKIPLSEKIITNDK